MKKITRSAAITLVNESQKKIVMSMAYWDVEFDLYEGESEVFECLRDQLVEQSTTNIKESSVGFFNIKRSVRDKKLLIVFCMIMATMERNLLLQTLHKVL